MSEHRPTTVLVPRRIRQRGVLVEADPIADRKGVPCRRGQLPLTSLVDDVAAVERARHAGRPAAPSRAFVGRDDHH
jgi:hypothetical protein